MIVLIKKFLPLFKGMDF